MRWLTATVAMAAIAAAFGVTWLKHDTRLLEAGVQAQQAQIDKTESEIAVLRAELGFLTRPERLEPLARRHLGMAPLEGHQIIGLEALPKLVPAGRTASTKAGGAP